MLRILQSILMAAMLATIGTQSDAKFLQPDWFEVTDPMVGTNRYAYSLNDPINLSDPSGNAPDYGYNTPGSYYCGCSNGYYDERRNLRTDDSRPNNDHNRFIDNFNASVRHTYEVQMYRNESNALFSTEMLVYGLNEISGHGFTPSPFSGTVRSGDEIFSLIPGYKLGTAAFQSTRAMVAALLSRKTLTTATAKSLSAAAVPTTLQTGGRTISNKTAKALNEALGTKLDRREWGRALEKMKRDLGLRNDNHGKIFSDGSYGNSPGDILGYLDDYIK